MGIIIIIYMADYNIYRNCKIERTFTSFGKQKRDNMNYIIFDLEWNQPVDGRPNCERELLFEIIEIGAVKLNEKREKIGEFSELIRPVVYHKLNWHTQKMLKLKMADLRDKRSFPEVFESFINWCGEDAVFCSWGSQDLTELQRNMRYHKMSPLGKGPIAYYDVQKLYAIQREEEEVHRNLETAVDLMGMEKDIPFHRAYGDAYYTAKIFAKLDKQIIEEHISYDLFRIPASEKEEIKEFHGKEYQLITCGYKERTDVSENRKIITMNCYLCNNRSIRPKVRWFSTNTKIYYGACICPIHGPIKGRLKIRKNEQGLYFAEKNMIYTTVSEIEKIKEKKNAIKKKKVSEEKNENANRNKNVSQNIKKSKQ